MTLARCSADSNFAENRRSRFSHAASPLSPNDFKTKWKKQNKGMSAKQSAISPNKLRLKTTKLLLSSDCKKIHHIAFKYHIHIQFHSMHEAMKNNLKSTFIFLDFSLLIVKRTSKFHNGNSFMNENYDEIIT
jgi:hypothetical protein